jgi:polyisoprenyl-teichoic acid--peptidoglycan teichoic acid transferase
VEYAYAIHDLKPSKITMVGLPGDSVISGGGYLGEQLLPVGRQYFEAVAEGRAAAFIAAHPELVNK